MSQVLYRKWRPKQWHEVVGQEHIVQTLRNSVVAGRVGHAYLFAGPRGTGKTTVARLLAKAVNCLAEDAANRPCNQCQHCQAVNENRFLDLIEIDAASQTGVDDVRDLRDKINFAPSQGRYKVYIIDEVHMFSTSAFNALLKTLEEPPPHAIFVLATTEIHKIPATVLSRCQRHEFRRLPVNEIVGQLKQIAKDEGLKADDDALTLIARQATGSLRDAISLLDQLASSGASITLSLAQTVLATAASQTVLDVVEAIRARRPAAGLETIHRALDAGAEARALARQLVDYLRGLLLIQMGNAAQVEAAADLKKQMEAHAAAFATGEVLHMMRLFNAAATDLRGGWQPSLTLELALAEIMETAGAVPSLATGGPAPATKVARPAAAPPAATPEPAAVKKTESRPAAESAAPAKRKGASPSVSLAQIVQAWKQMRELIRPEDPILDALLNSCKPLEVKDGVLVLGFASDVLTSKMKSEQIERTRAAIARVLGVEVDIRCVVTHAKNKVPSHLPQEGMVATALHHGGEIVDVQE